MRDTLTALAGVVILILVAALAVPPFIDWADHRALIDRAIGTSLGLPARSEGRIEVRLLPSPRLRLDRVELGSGLGKPALDARFVKAEVALAPLLKGEFRFTETRIGRAELKLPITESDAVLVPPGAARVLGEHDFVIEDLHIQQFLLTTQVPATGRTDQLLAESVRIKTPSLSGPWQVEGASGGIPFRIATSAIADGALTVKVAAGGENKPRFEADARLGLKPIEAAADARATEAGQPRSLIPEAEGTARLALNPAQGTGSALPFSLSGKFKARGPIARFESVNAEIDPRGRTVRLTGSGRVDLRNWRAALSLESRRLDIDGLIYSTAGQALMRRGLPALGMTLPVSLDLDLKAESLAFGFEDWSDLSFKGTFGRSGSLILRQFGGIAPGAARIGASGEVDLATPTRFSGHLDLDAANSQGFGRYLGKLGIEAPGLALLDGRAVQVASDVAATAGDVSLSNLRLTLGDARIAGNARYLRAENGARGRLDAQLNAQGVDIAELPPLGGVLNGLERHDVGLKVQARDVRYGPSGASSGTGTVAASIQSDGASLVVDSLDVTDLAGANAKLKGRIAQDGSGRIAGRVGAPVAAPLLALVERIWLPDARRLPRFVLDGALDLDVTLEREAGQADTLRGTAKGSAADSALDLSLLTRAGVIETIDLTASVPQAARWFGRADIAGLRQPGKLTFSGKARGGEAAPRLDLGVNGTVAGLTIATSQPLALVDDQGSPESGALRFETADLGPFLRLAGSATATGPLPAQLNVALSRRGDEPHAEVSGRIAETPVSAAIDRRGEAYGGQASFGRLSLPAIAAALVLPTEPRGTGDVAGWSSAKFQQPPAHPRADVALRADTLDLGHGLVARDAAFGLALDGDTLTLRDLKAKLAGGQVAGSATFVRQGGNATISGDGRVTDAALGSLAADGPIRAKLSASLRYSATGDSAAALIGNLGGSGDIALSDLSVAGADPAAIDRALARALAEDDPLREGRVQALLGEELSAAPLSPKGPVSAAATLVGGTLRSAPLSLDFGTTRWNGSFAFDLRTRRLDARGTLVSGTAPKGWVGGKPSIQLGLTGPLTAPLRDVDAGPLSNGLSALVLQRELEKIELFEADQAERTRRRARIEMDLARAAAIKAAAEKAAKEKAAAEEAARQARLRAQQAAAEEAARQARDRQNADDDARRGQERDNAPPPDSPLDIRPSPQP